VVGIGRTIEKLYAGRVADSVSQERHYVGAPAFAHVGDAFDGGHDVGVIVAEAL
jgi:hypothetical protein